MSEEKAQIYDILMRMGVYTSKGWEVILREDPQVRGCWLALCIHPKLNDIAFLLYTNEHLTIKGDAEEVGFEYALKYFPSEVKERMNEQTGTRRVTDVSCYKGGRY